MTGLSLSGENRVLSGRRGEGFENYFPFSATK